MLSNVREVLLRTGEEVGSCCRTAGEGALERSSTGHQTRPVRLARLWSPAQRRLLLAVEAGVIPECHYNASKSFILCKLGGCGALIRIDDDVYETLQRRAEPFVDSPNTVLRRILLLDEPAERERKAVESPARAQQKKPKPVRGAPKRAKAPGRRRKARRASSANLLPESEYELPLLKALHELGGTAPTREVIQALGKKLDGRLTALDKSKIHSGGVRWMNRAQFVRLSLVRSGDLRADPPRGVWAISEQGQRRLRTAQ